MAALPIAVPTLRMSEQEYLRTEFEVAAEFVDGVIEERNVGEYGHSTWQDAPQAWFRANYPEWRLRARPEWRTKVSATRYRVPDVAVTSMDQPIEEVIVTAPVAVFEILSPEDTMRRTVTKLQDYQRMGIRNIFVIDPDGPQIFHFHEGELGPAAARVSLEGAAGHVDWQAIQDLMY